MGSGSIPGHGTKIPHAVKCGQKKEEEEEDHLKTQRHLREELHHVMAKAKTGVTQPQIRD